MTREVAVSAGAVLPMDASAMSIVRSQTPELRAQVVE